MSHVVRQEDDVRERFARELNAHVDNVLSLLQVTMPPGALRRACAMELMSMTGGAAVMGVPEATDLAGSLGELLAAGETELGTTFWRSFALWFKRCAEHIGAIARSRRSPHETSTLTQERARLELDVRRRSHDMSQPPTRLLAAGRRVMFVDDSATARHVVVATLKDCGYDARAAADLRETAVLLLDFEPEIVISDVHLPGIEGDQLCRRIKQSMRRLVPIVLYSSLPEAELAQRAKVAGADAYVTKHAGVADLVRRVDMLLSSEVLF